MTLVVPAAPETLGWHEVPLDSLTLGQEVRITETVTKGYRPPNANPDDELRHQENWGARSAHGVIVVTSDQASNKQHVYVEPKFEPGNTVPQPLSIFGPSREQAIGYGEVLVLIVVCLIPPIEPV